MFNIWQIKYIRPYLKSEACQTLISSLVMSYLEYTNSLLWVARMWHKSPSESAKLCRNNGTQQIQVWKSHTRFHWPSFITHKTMNWILPLMFNCINKTAHQYLIGLIHWKEAGIYGLWSGNSHRLLKIPATKRKTFANHSFSVAGPNLWNSLPDYLRLASAIDEFKKDLKTHLFQTNF